jgi:hypothetical protein
MDLDALKKHWNAPGQWVYVVPIDGVILTEAVDYEFRIKHMVLVHRSKMARIRGRLGISQRLSKLRKSRWSDGVLEASEVYAVVRTGGTPDVARKRCRRIVRQELALLAVSQLGYDSRSSRAFPSIHGEGARGAIEDLLIESPAGRTLPTVLLTGKLGDIALHGHWLRFQRETFFLGLLQIIRGKSEASPAWARDIERACVLLGQSLCSTNAAAAFLLNMIALEALFVGKQGKFRENLPRVAEAFLGWTGFWLTKRYPERIQEIYAKRTGFVHWADGEPITGSDVEFTDLLLFHLIWNLVEHIRLFPTRKAVVEFSKKVEAEHLLGIRSRVRPRTLRYAALRERSGTFEME